MSLERNIDPKKRKIVHENRSFNSKWTEDYLFIENKDHAICLICHAIVPVLKKYNLSRHYMKNHAHKYDAYAGNLRLDKIKCLQNQLLIQQNSFKKSSDQNENMVKASYVVANLIAKKSKPFNDGEFIKECLESVADIICPDKKSIFSKISLSHQTVATRMGEIGNLLENSLKTKCHDFKFYSLAMDESIDASDTAQFVIFIRGIDDNYNIIEEMGALIPLKNNTKSTDLYEALKITLDRFSLSTNNLSAIITDGAPAMVGKNGGVVKMVMDESLVAGNVMLMAYHCILHQENLCGKIIKMENVTSVVITSINFIRRKGLNHRQFQEFIKSMNAEFEDVIYYTEVRWLSKGKMLKRFYVLLNEIKIFMETKGKVVPEFEDDNWLSDLAFMVDIFEHLNELNLRLQGKNQFIHSMFQAITAFETKLKLWHDQIKLNDLTYFSTLAIHQPISCEKYAAVILEIIKEFERRFYDFRTKEEFFNIFGSPFSIEIKNVASRFQMECVELQADIELKGKFFNVPLLEFYKNYLPRHKYPNLHNHALFMASCFGSTYICEQLFSRMEYTKNKVRNRITDTHLENSLRIATSSIEPNIDLLVQKKQIHPSH